jgi:hypothetical protein
VKGKSYPAIGVCGIDCGLCPIHHVKAGNGCGGCTAPGPSYTAGRWCAIARCAVRDHGYETCAACAEFPCERLTGWDGGDSVVTHKNSLANLRTIKEHGIEQFVAQQRERIALLDTMLSEFDDGRSKGFFCLAATLLPLEDGADLKSRAAILRRILGSAASRLGISLKLRKYVKRKA